MSTKQVPVVQSGKLESGIRVGSKNWDKEIESLDSFRYVPDSDNAPFTARKEKGGGQADYWYGYRKVNGKLHKRYIGKACELKIERLERIAAQLNIPPEPRPEKRVTDSIYVTNKYVKQLQQQIEGLEAKLQNRDRELAEASKQVESLTLKLSTVRDESDELHRELHNLTSVQDYQQLREIYLKSLRLGRQAPEYKKAEKHIKQFINLIENQQ